MLRVLPILLVVFLLALSRAAVVPTESEAVSSAGSEAMADVSIPESREKDLMPEEQSVDADMEAQDWPMYYNYPWFYRPWFSDRRYFAPTFHRNAYWKSFNEEGKHEEVHKLLKRDNEYELANIQRDTVMESAFVAAQNDEVKLHTLVQTYPTYFYRFYRPVYNRYCAYYPRLYRKNPAYFRVHHPVMYREYASGRFVPTATVSKFILSSEDDMEPKTGDIPSADVEAQNQLNKRDEGFETEAQRFTTFCVKAIAGHHPVASRILAQCRQIMGVSPFDYNYDPYMYWDYPDMGTSIRAEVYRRLGRSFHDALAEAE